MNSKCQWFALWHNVHLAWWIKMITKYSEADIVQIWGGYCTSGRKRHILVTGVFGYADHFYPRIRAIRPLLHAQNPRWPPNFFSNIRLVWLHNFWPVSFRMIFLVSKYIFWGSRILFSWRYMLFDSSFMVKIQDGCQNCDFVTFVLLQIERWFWCQRIWFWGQG